MNQKEIAVFLQKVPIFHGLNTRHLERLATRVYERDYAANEVIVKQGEGGVGLFIVTSGKAEAVIERPDGTRSVVNTFGSTDFFGELALLDEGLRTASVITTEPTKCLGLLRWDFIGTLNNDAEMAVVILQELARRFRSTLGSMQ